MCQLHIMGISLIKAVKLQFQKHSSTFEILKLAQSNSISSTPTNPTHHMWHEGSFKETPDCPFKNASVDGRIFFYSFGFSGHDVTRDTLIKFSRGT